MFDPEFKKLYDAVKDSSWPDIHEYKDFVSLDPSIKNECFEMHGLQNRINEIADKNYWTNLTADFCVFGNLAFVPVPKCAFSYYTQTLTEQGWKRVKLKDLDIESTHFFGFMMHPLKRYLKGIAQMIVFSCVRSKTLDPLNTWKAPYDIDWQGVESMLESQYLQNLLNMVLVGDVHAMPYYFFLGDLIDKVHWIPMDTMSDDEMKLHAMAFCKQHGQDLSLKLNSQRIHESPPLQLKAYEIIKNIFFNPSGTQENQITSFYKIFGPDLKFYYQLLNNFQKTP
jgi:hypothetical protein